MGPAYMPAPLALQDRRGPKDPCMDLKLAPGTDRIADQATPSQRLHDWLVRDAYPLWATTGVDSNGGFFERIDREGAAVRGRRRARVLGRQIYAFARAGALGWKGPAAQIVRHGLDTLPRFLREDGLASACIDDHGRPLPGPVDLYDQAFILFGLAHATPFATGRMDVLGTARRLRSGLGTLAHPGGGFEETVPRSLPLKANPHMHLLEAGLAWGEVEGRPDGEAWDTFTDGLAELALRRFVDPATGAVHEHYDGDWVRSGDPALAVVEPGHQFEWGWLLIRWGEARSRADAVTAGRRLVEVGEAYGLDPVTGLTIGELNPDLSPRPFHARLWAQGERVKAWAQAALRAEDAAVRAAALDRMEAAAAALTQFLHDRPQGAWHDRMTAGRTFVVEAAPASSLYHIVGAVEEAAWARETRRRG